MSARPPEKRDRNIAFVIVDVQRKFTGGNISEEGCREHVRVINEAAELFRKSGMPVIFVYYDGPCNSSVYGKDDGDEYLWDIVSDAKDIIVHKVGMNSFRNTGLAEAVKECGCDSIVLAGMVTQLCVVGTYYGAFEHGIVPYLLKDGMISSDGRFNDAACTLCGTFTLDEIRENILSRKTEMPAEMYGRNYPRPSSAGR